MRVIFFAAAAAWLTAPPTLPAQSAPSPVVQATMGAAGSTTVTATGSDPSDDPNYTISPQSVTRGKDYNLVVRPRGQCDESKAPMKGFHVDLSGVSGFTYTDLGSDTGCFLRLKLTVADDAPLGPLNVPLVKQLDAGQTCPGSKATTCGVGMLRLDVASVDRGPIPPGLTAQADIFWKVLPLKPTQDSFGSYFARRFFAIEVTVGNDTGYDLQLTGVAFEPPGGKYDAPIPTDAYNVGRSSMERDQEVGARAVVVNTIKSLGPIMAGGANFFYYTGAQARWSGVNAIFSGPFEKGVELVWPDKTVRHLNALDNRSLRDSIVIPNNISQRLLVFMSRQIVECSSGETSRDHQEREAKARAAGKTGGDRNQAKQGDDSAGDVKDIGCSWTSASKTAGGRLAHKGDYDPLEVMRRMGTLVIIGKQVQYLNRVRMVSTPQPVVQAPPVVQAVDLTVSQGDAAKSFPLVGTGLHGAGVSIEADATKIHITDVTPSSDGSRVDFKAAADLDAPPGKFKLFVSTPSGNQALDFTVKAQTPTPDKSTDAKPNPNPNTLTQGDSAQNVVITGTNLDNVTASITDSTAKIAIGTFTAPAAASGSQTLTLPVTVPADTPPGKYQIQLKRFDQTATVAITIKGAKPTVTTTTATGKGTSDSPYSLVIQGTNLSTATVTVPDGSTIPKPTCKGAAAKLTCSVDTSKAKAGDVVVMTVVNDGQAADQTVTFTVAQ